MRVPRVRDDPGFVFHVVGANALPASILALNGSTLGGLHERVHVHGYVAQVSKPYLLRALTRTHCTLTVFTLPTLALCTATCSCYVAQLRPLFSRMRLSVAPLRWGAGVKGKVNSAHQ